VVIPDSLIASARAVTADVAGQRNSVELKLGDGTERNALVLHLQVAVDPELDLPIGLSWRVQLHYHLKVDPLAAGDIGRRADVLPKLLAVSGRLIEVIAIHHRFATIFLRRRVEAAVRCGSVVIPTVRHDLEEAMRLVVAVGSLSSRQHIGDRVMAMDDERFGFAGELVAGFILAVKAPVIHVAARQGIFERELRLVRTGDVLELLSAHAHASDAGRDGDVVRVRVIHPIGKIRREHRG